MTKNPEMARYPMLLKAVEHISSDNGMPMRGNIFTIRVPQEWVKRFDLAEATAADMHEKELTHFIDENMLDIDICDPADDALETMCCGEETIMGLLTAAAHASVLQEVLESMFEGELSDIFFAI